MPIVLSAVGNGGAMTSAPGSILVHNAGKGNMDWTTTIIYLVGKDWLVLTPPSGTNDAAVQVTVNTKNLLPGIYQGGFIVDAGDAGRNSVFVNLTVSAPPAPSVIVSQVWSSATLETAPLVPGSLTTLMGSHLSGKNVAVTFDGALADLLYVSDPQINLQVPFALVSKTSTVMVVTVDGVSSAPLTVSVAAAWPAVFPHGIFNQDNRENTPSTPAKSGDVLQIYATGIPTKTASVSVQIGNRGGLAPIYICDPSYRECNRSTSRSRPG